MSLLKEIRKLSLLSIGLAAISFAPTPANAVPVDTPAGTCVGADDSGGAGVDCVTTTGHMSASVVSTLSINEIRAVSFGNMATPCGGGACTTGDGDIILNAATGARTQTGLTTDTIVMLHGADANDGAAGNAGNANSGGQAPGVYRVSAGAEGAATQVYIAFADNAGNFVDYSGENFYTANDTNIHLIGPAAAYFTAQDFTIDCTGAASDVYGHYCDNTTLPLDVKVGATLKTVVGQTYGAGKYVATYNVMVSY